MSLVGCSIHYDDDDCEPSHPDYSHTERVCDRYNYCRSLHVCSWAPTYSTYRPMQRIVVYGEWLECYPQEGVWYGNDYEDYGYFCTYTPRRMCYYCPDARVR